MINRGDYDPNLTPDWHLPEPPRHCGQLVTEPTCPTCGDLINAALNRRAD